MEPEGSSAVQNASSEGPDAISADQLSINLKVISPSLSQPLLLSDLPAASTIQQLKERIRQELPTRPADNQQRLIYRGRMVNRAEEKLLGLFGEDMIRSSDQQSIHLIIPDQSESPATTTPVRGPSPISAPRGHDGVNPAHQYFDSVLQQNARYTSTGRRLPPSTTAAVPPSALLPNGPQRAASGATPMTEHHHNTPSPHPAAPHGPHHVHPAAPQMYRGQPTPTQYTSQGFQQMAHRLSREAAIHRAYLSQWDRTGGLPAGMRAPQVPVTNPLDAAQRRSSPAPLNYEGHPTADHQRLRGGGPEAGMSDAEVQNILRGADARQAILTMTNAMQRSVSGTSFGPQSGRATPNSLSGVAGGSSAAGVSTGFQAPTSSNSQSSPEVYIVYSPTGPRGLLINSSSSEMYYTPSTRPPTSTTPLLGLPNIPPYRPFSAQVAAPDQHAPGAEQPEMNQEDQGDGAQGRLRRRVRVRLNQPAGPAGPRRHNPAGAVAFVARAWPHFWLAFRLGLFVWWFTSSASSWSRWAAVVSIAIAIFVLNTGALDGLADTIWRVVCRHMENLIPMPGQNPADPQADQAQNNQAPQHGPREDDPQPEDMAARLVGNRRRGNASWLLDHVRRMERAGLLFLASIAPGVAERHIANLEAEMERQRREAEAAAEEARRAAEAERVDVNPEEAGVERAEGAGVAEDTQPGRPPSPPPPPQPLPAEAAPAL
ncbi:uncharacterized protein DNG_01864 [Cephalotrichum gorgonifer]|uniref:Ubiquitin-like domain-containing protein n=1 Tax=Cephalotrichum gorgonifer TaxID=2041049 RepID=A0AAE8MTX3_9PEZI|nr:uncharacterized protein DNG_01864 [Cephalotrichum gorgonifer]